MLEPVDTRTAYRGIANLAWPTSAPQIWKGWDRTVSKRGLEQSVAKLRDLDEQYVSL